MPEALDRLSWKRCVSTSLRQCWQQFTVCARAAEIYGRTFGRVSFADPHPENSTLATTVYVAALAPAIARMLYTTGLPRHRSTSRTPTYAPQRAHHRRSDHVGDRARASGCAPQIPVHPHGSKKIMSFEKTFDLQQDFQSTKCSAPLLTNHRLWLTEPLSMCRNILKSRLI